MNVITAAGVNKVYTVPTANPSGFNVWRVYSVDLNTMAITDINDFVDDASGDATTICVPAGSEPAPASS